MRLAVALLASATRVSALRIGTLAAAQQPRATALMASDDDLMASLRARMNKESNGNNAAPAPLGPDEVGADNLGPKDVVEYIMRSLAASDAGSEDGLRALMGFSIVHDDGQQVDTLGQVQPGCFSSTDALRSFFAAAEMGRYEALGALDEWKLMGPPDMSNMSRNAAQKLLVRCDGSNWKDLFINLSLAKAKVGDTVIPRWLVVSIYMSGQ